MGRVLGVWYLVVMVEQFDLVHEETGGSYKA
jgi:hypothetical protein